MDTPISDDEGPVAVIHTIIHMHTGVGVVFDTFKNTEHGAKHRDVAVFVNDGTKTQADMLQTFEGW